MKFQNIKKYLQRGAIVSSILFANALTINAQQNPVFKEELGSNINNKVNSFIGKVGFQPISLPGLVATVIQAFLSILAIIFLGLIFFGGYVWMMARGNDNEVDRARGIIRHSIIGLIITISSYAIAYFVLFWLSTNGKGTPTGP